jgi:hypothetical protein
MGNKIDAAGGVVAILIEFIGTTVFVYLTLAYLLKASPITSLILIAVWIVANIGLRIFYLRQLRRSANLAELTIYVSLSRRSVSRVEKVRVTRAILRYLRSSFRPL